MGVSIDVHCHLLQADGVERESFVKAWLGLNALPNSVVRRIINFVLSGSIHLSPALRKAIKGVLGNAAYQFCCQVEMASAQFWPLFNSTPQKIVESLLAAFPPTETDLFVPLMTDYEEWLGGEPQWYAWKPSQTHPQSRVEWKKQVIRESGGRVHPFAPFCPLRAAGDGIEDEVGKAVDLVENHGFLGVKLYPLMGYYPCRNAAKCKPDWLPAERREAGVRWRHLDAALDALYTACADREIPITAHCSPQGSRGPHGSSARDKSQANQAHPRNWLPVLRRHPNLRLNLAHMAGDHFQTLDAGEKGTMTDWAFQIATLMGDGDCSHVYADRSCQLPPSDPQERALYAHRLFEVLALNGEVPKRVMNGTDWHLALMYGEYAGEWQEANARFWFICGLHPDFTDRFFGESAADFLGLRPGARNRERLRRFYVEKLGLSEAQFPAWWSKTQAGGPV